MQALILSGGRMVLRLRHQTGSQSVQIQFRAQAKAFSICKTGIIIFPSAIFTVLIAHFLTRKSFLLHVCIQPHGTQVSIEASIDAIVYVIHNVTTWLLRFIFTDSRLDLYVWKDAGILEDASVQSTLQNQLENYGASQRENG